MVCVGLVCAQVAFAADIRGGRPERISAAQPADTCPPAGQRVVAKNKYLVVYTDQPGGPEEGAFSVCDRTRRREGAGLGEQAQTPSITLRGHSVAYADVSCEVDGSCSVFMSIRALGIFSATLSAAKFALPFVIQTVIAPDRSLVWIACHRAGRDLLVPNPVPRKCLHGDRLRDVYAASLALLKQRPVPQTPVLLDHGHGIKGRSLRVRHGRVYWTHSSKSRSARLSS
jgi:hypothetical protein